MQSTFEEKQTAVWTLPLLVFAVLIMVYGYFFSAPEAKDFAGFFTVVLAMLAVALFFYQLKTKVDDKNIELKFGIGLVNKNIALSELESATVVRNKWYYGWGIRYIGKGWMWNISGLDAVELRFSNKKSVFRIGTRQAEKLKNAIESNLSKT